MEKKAPSVEVINIQLTEFTYNPDYDFSTVDEVDLRVTVLTRVPPEKEQLDIMVKIAYHDKKTSDSVLVTSCVTNYAMTGMNKGTEPESGDATVDIPAQLLRLMKIEAVAHARAIVAVQAAATPFGQTYVSSGKSEIARLIREEVEVAAVREPKARNTTKNKK